MLGDELHEWLLRNRLREWDAYRATVGDAERRSFPELL